MEMPVTTFSIGIDTAEVMKQKVKEAAAFPKLKVKIGLANDEENIAAIRSVSTSRITSTRTRAGRRSRRRRRRSSG